MSCKDKINCEKLPSHVAIIMDGNGRWAVARNQNRTFGHIEGARTVRKMVEACRELGIRYLTLYAFSTENWNRPQDEINALMNLLVEHLRSETPLLMEQSIRLRIIGDIESLSPETGAVLQKSLEETSKNQAMDLVLALSYSARREITQMARRLSREIEWGNLRSSDISEKTIENFLETKEIPDPDLMIRTGGEFRVSNFLLWQIAYSELYFSPILWPDFSKENFYETIVDYQNRERRFGKTSEQIISETKE